MIYLDSCALVKLVITEDETAALTRFLAGREAELVTSELAITELVRVVRRSCFDSQRGLRVPEAVLNDRLALAGDLLDRMDQVVVDTDTFIRAGMFTDDPLLGSLDALHLVCALELGAELTSFVTYGRALTQAAQLKGLPVVRPA